MKAGQVIYAWDYHHGQATRVIMGGLPHLPGKTMLEKQAAFIELCDPIRASLMQEPRGHTNMLGAVVTEPVTPDGNAGLLFLSPHGYFEMCGDSTFSAVAALVDSGRVAYDDPDGHLLVKLDTVAGRVEAQVRLQAGEPAAITFDNVPSYSLGERSFEAPRTGQVSALTGFGGLLYVFIEAAQVGIPSLCDIPRDELLEMGTRLWKAAREQVSLPAYVGPDRVGEPRPVDLITIWEPLQDERGARVANFYAPYTTGRTPSGTGLAARVAIEAAARRLQEGETFIHESLLGLRFQARAVHMHTPRADGGLAGCVPAITARSFLMGISQWILHPEDPFRHGFIF